MQFTITIPKEEEQSVVEAFCSVYGYDTIPEEERPSREDFVSSKVLSFVSETTRSFLLTLLTNQITEESMAETSSSSISVK